ncbi:MAG: DUF2779 domain-containing protein [Desulfobacterales bacterium]|nr:MAG: DUF2779 domain-containing protein [Desulfobacterales bacterium]
MNSRRSPTLSKSRFLAGLQCHLRLWYQCYAPQLASEISPAKQSIFDSAHEVEKLARQLYPRGVLIEEDYLRHEEAVTSTAALMKDSKIQAICEAAFLYDGVRVRADILERFGHGSWNLVEVKSSASVKHVYLWDIAVQYYVLTGCAVRISQAGILHVNNQYFYDESELDLDSIFTFADLTHQVVHLQDEIRSNLSDLKAILAKENAPEIKPSRHCMRPYLCEFWEYCTRKMPEFWVLNLNGINQEKLDQLTESEVQDIRDIPDSFALTRIQNRIRTSIINQQEYISKELKAEFDEASYPIHFLDFETVGPAIPRYTSTRPYQAIPFQWSNHIFYQNGTLEHNEYLCCEDKDPREEFTITLLDTLGNDGSIFIYTTYEKDIIRQLAEHLPFYREQLIETLDRFIDLCAIIRKYYYHPRFYGSFSLKFVLPALLPEMSYENLVIQEGNQASFAYLRMIDPSTPPEAKRTIRNNLLKYCGYDTLAMVKIRAELLKRISENSIV